MLTLFSALLATASALPVGSWSAPPNALPDSKLPGVPLAGNGHLGAALDASSRARNGSTAGPGMLSAVDVWLDTTSMWSCTVCGAVDPDRDAAACCSVVALGGLSVRHPGFARAAFAAEQRVADGTLTTASRSPVGGLLATATVVHPAADVVVTNVTYAAGPGEPPALNVTLSTWVLGRSVGSPADNTGIAAPARAGCARADGAETPCGAGAALAFVSRNASTVSADVMPVSAALATGAALGPGATLVRAAVTTAPGAPPGAPWEVSLTVTVPSGSWAAAVTAEAETRGPGLGDPVSRALAAAAAAAAGPPGATAAAAAAWWAAFWARSSVTLPTRPRVEALWAGAQYVLAAASSADPRVPPPGLYGPWATEDGPSWHGDYTLDYNYAAPYYGVFGANHAPQAESYWGPIVDWVPAARVKAQAEAARAHVTCPATALYYACHLAPYGLVSLDGMTRYMTWNGPHAVLLFLNHFEYTLNASFAEAVTLPLLAGMNDWWACYLNKTATGRPAPDDYVYDDVNSYNGDYEHEGQIVPNPQIALAFVYRTVRAHADLAAQLGVPLPPAVADIAAHLPPLNVGPAAFPGAGANFSRLPDTRCNGDLATWYDVPDADACSAACARLAPCGVFSYCPPYAGGPPSGGCSGAGGEPRPNTCWGYAPSRLPECTSRPQDAGWTSGARVGGGNVTAPVWTAFRGAALADSDWFAGYPLWPSEALEPGGADDAAVAQATSRAYSDFVGGRPVDLFALAVRAGANASFAPAWAPGDVLDSLDAYLAAHFGSNLLAYAPGGGVENTGIARAVHEMLLQARPLGGPGRWALALFPMWPPGEPAAFTSLLAKGGFAVSARWDNATRAVASPVSVTAQHTLRGAASSRAVIVGPWPGGGTVACGGTAVPAAWDGARLAWDAPLGVPCLVSQPA